jgi:hypothetical protein
MEFDENVILKMRDRKRKTTAAAADREKAEHQSFTTKKNTRKKTHRTELLGVRVTKELKDWFTAEANVQNKMLVELLEEMVEIYRKKKARSQ